MVIVPLSAIPNQMISIKLNNENYDITIQDINDTGDPELNLMTATIVRNNVEIISGFRIVAGYPLIPYRYLESGDFAFTIDDEEYPSYLRFGIDQFLLYRDPIEMEALRAEA